MKKMKETNEKKQMEEFLKLSHDYREMRKDIEAAQKNEKLKETLKEVFQKRDVKVWDFVYELITHTQPKNITNCKINWQHNYILVTYDYENPSNFCLNAFNVTKKIYF